MRRLTRLKIETKAYTLRIRRRSGASGIGKVVLGSCLMGNWDKGVKRQLGGAVGVRLLRSKVEYFGASILFEEGVRGSAAKVEGRRGQGGGAA